MSFKLSDNSQTQKILVPCKIIIGWLKKYHIYHQYTIITNLYLKLRPIVGFLIHIL